MYYENLNKACHIKYYVALFKIMIKLQKCIRNIKNMIRRCKITEIFSYFGEFFSNTSQTPKILLSSI